MAGRRLNRRQQWRIGKIQAERASRARRHQTRLETRINEGELGPEREGLVVAHYGTQIDIEPIEGEPIDIASADLEPAGTRSGVSISDAARTAFDATAPGGERRAARRCHMRANLGSVVTGDRVIWRDGNPTGVAVAMLPRVSELVRPDGHGQLKVVAANIDRIVIVIAPHPKAHANLIDRYLVAAETLGIKPLVLLNKCDRIDATNQSYLDSLLQPYKNLNYAVFRVSTHAGQGLGPLSDYLADYTSIFVGQSGVGKSSLINALLPGANTRVGDLSPGAQKGMHTTTTAQLFHFPAGGRLIDSPGIREFGLWHLEARQVLEGFIEFRPFLGQCRFRDCGHRGEPGCAIAQALRRGNISGERMDSCRQILASLDQGSAGNR